MSVFKESNWSDGQALDYADMNNMSKWLRSQMFDTLGGLAQITEQDTAPSTSHLFASGTGGAPNAGVGLTVTNVAGVVFQRTNAVDGSDVAFAPYYLAANELSQALTAADPTNPRIDLVCVKIDHNADTSVSRDSEAPSGVITTQSFNSSRSPRIQKVLVTGTPAGSPVEGSVPGGYVKWCAVKVPAAATSIVLSDIYDYRVPLGLKAYDVMGIDSHYVTSVWNVSSFKLDIVHPAANLSPDPAYFTPRTAGSNGRVLAVQMVRKWDSAGGTPAANLVRLDMTTAGPTPTTVRSASALVSVADTVFAVKSVDLSAEALWVNGYPNAYAVNTFAADVILRRLALKWEAAGGGAEDVLRMVRFWIAG